MKFETVRILFFKWRFGLLPSRNFATMATWRNDFSLLTRFNKHVQKNARKIQLRMNESYNEVFYLLYLALKLL